MLAGGAEALSHAPLVFRRSAVEWYARMFGARDVWSRLKAAAGFPSVVPQAGDRPRARPDRSGGRAQHGPDRRDSRPPLRRVARATPTRYAVESQQRLARAQEEGWFAGELEPAFDRDGKVYDHDDGVRPDSTVEKLAELKPAFERPWGKVTAGNSSQITDGASWVILASETAVERARSHSRAR